MELPAMYVQVALITSSLVSPEEAPSGGGDPFLGEAPALPPAYLLCSSLLWEGQGCIFSSVLSDDV